MRISTNASQIANVFKRYAALNGRDPLQLLHNQALELVGGPKSGKPSLLSLTWQAAPNLSQLQSDVKKQGWKIPVKFPDGRLGRGTPKMWGDLQVKKLPVRRGRKSKSRLEQEAQIRGRANNLEAMQAFVIQR